MTVYIGNAVGDEHGKASGGEPGNQTGKELRIQAWYKNKKGWRVFRAKEPAMRELLAYDMRAACENHAIGYDQKQRNTLYTVASAVGFDCERVATPCECDCSSLVRVCLAYAGVRVQDFNTASEPSRLLATGLFDEMKGTKYTDGYHYLKAGDILCTAVKGHTAIVLNDGDKAEPDPAPPVTEQQVEVVGKSVNVRTADSKKGRILFTAHRGDRFPFVAVAPSGWYEIDTKKGQGFITSLPKYTKIVKAEGEDV